MACGDPKTCLHCAMADLVNERFATGAIVTPAEAYHHVVALAGDFIAAAAERSPKELAERFKEDLGIAVTVMSHPDPAAVRAVCSWQRRIAS